MHLVPKGKKVKTFIKFSEKVEQTEGLAAVHVDQKGLKKNENGGYWTSRHSITIQSLLTHVMVKMQETTRSR